MANDKRVDQPTGTEFVGHEWDGIEELNTPLPRWWLWTFYLTIVFSIGYVVAYPAIPMLSKATEGMLGWSSRGALAKELGAAERQRAEVAQRIAAVDLATLAADEGLMQQARAGGAAAFKVNCSQCHGSGAGGSHELGYPNLNDDDWLWGGDLAAIEYSIKHGIRQEGAELRQGVMPPFAGAIEGAQLEALVQHVRWLSGLAQPNAAGVQTYADNCAACHGAGGEGDRTIGAPRLNDAIWLRGSSAAAIKAQILNPKMGAMPAWGERLDPVTVRMLAAYVHSLGGGEAAVVEETPEPASPEPASDTDGQR
ncbi:cytochrome-c oxidase, cbb3-type subunit III [Parerythrobacter aestuarii]|uniref:cytochrome-c oxidase, cbb3-type subunit III n=1 Tax=Parerythrobacter aestuarii TaxID=3020909 RepID=UPI0024DE7D37|nr:cytochrome-c oxidase, cbb3-type subunit III [Parerythrobacter aestuarii]